MPIKIKYTEDGTGIIFIAFDVVTGKDIVEANKDIYSRKNFPKMKYKIADRTKCTEYLVKGSEVRMIAEQEKEASKINPDFIVALVSKSDHQYGMTRMYHAYMGDEGFLSEVFDDQESAKSWINEQLKKSEEGNGV